MIVGLGIDLVDADRIARELDREQWQAANGIFTTAEIGYCKVASRPERRYAACFAAKEATLKALGTDIADLGIFREVEIRLDGEGDGAVLLRKRLRTMARKLGARHINLSVAVRAKSAVAMVILES
jgi:holo-[acyl-carrier protein] synthase